jgi:hypothetical protein
MQEDEQMKHRVMDPVISDELKMDRDQTAQTQRYEKALSMATAAYNRGEFDDEIQDKCDPADAAKIAIAVLHYLDDAQVKSMPKSFSITSWLRFVPCQIRDFRATVDGVLERHAQEILEHD